MTTAIIEDKQFWEQQIKHLKTSGLTRSQYCRNNGVNYDRFGYWLKKLSLASSEFIPIKLQVPDTKLLNVTLCTIELHGHIVKIHELSALSFILERLV